jgi:hypothetical protein
MTIEGVAVTKLRASLGKTIWERGGNGLRKKIRGKEEK